MKRIVAMLFLLTSLSSCIKTSSEKTFKIVDKKGGVWHIDKMTVTTIVYSNDKVESVDSYSDVGDFSFVGEDKDNLKLKFDGSIKLNTNYNLTYGPFETDIESFFDTEFYTNPGGIGNSTIYKISYLSKKKMRLFVPREINVYYTGPYEFNFYFECTRK